MCESLDGWMTPSTRQKSGSFLKDDRSGRGGGGSAGSVKAPAVIVLAEVMVVSGSFKAARLSQVAAASGAARSETESRTRGVIMGSLRGSISRREMKRAADQRR